MSDSATTPSSFEECAEELNDFIAGLQRYSPTVLAFALRVHLCELLRALRDHGQWTATEVVTFVEDMASDINE